MEPLINTLGDFVAALLILAVCAVLIGSLIDKLIGRPPMASRNTHSRSTDKRG